MENKEFEIGGEKVTGFKIDLPSAPLLVMVAPKGYVMCGYLDLVTAEKLGQAAAVVRGVKSFEDVLKAKVAGATSGAKALGVREGMSGRGALERMV